MSQSKCWQMPVEQSRGWRLPVRRGLACFHQRSLARGQPKAAFVTLHWLCSNKTLFAKAAASQMQFADSWASVPVASRLPPLARHLSTLAFCPGPRHSTLGEMAASGPQVWRETGLRDSVRSVSDSHFSSGLPSQGGKQV